MASIFLFSPAGSPGVTTTAVGLAHVWPRPVLVLECGLSNTTGIIPGYHRGALDHTRGLLQVVAAARGREVNMHDVMAQRIPLYPDLDKVPQGWSKYFVAGPRYADAARGMVSLWADLATAIPQMEDAGIDVIIDAGRYYPGDPRTPLFITADAPIAIIRPVLPDISALAADLRRPETTRDGLLERLEAVNHENYLSVLSIAGPVGNYSKGFTKPLRVPGLARLPWAPEHAAAFSLGEKPLRKALDKGPLVGALHATAAKIRTRTEKRDAELGVRPVAQEEVDA